ncbi:MAG: isochorismatase family protein [Burkholderiaceae bacterium]|nr:isochorismatase family protein [Burkholderiaceae bacterium]
MTLRSGTGSALLVVDVQVGVVAQAWDRDRIVVNISLAVRRAREAGVPVVWVQHDGDGLERGSAAWQWVPELEPLPGELRIHKRFNSAFEGTGLPGELDRLGVGRILLAGAATNWCVRATAYGALDRGYDVTLISDAHTTQDMAIEPGRVVEARSVIDELNVAMRWLAYPGRSNAAVPAADLAFA